jgi:hypothetical protein
MFRRLAGVEVEISPVTGGSPVHALDLLNVLG